METWTADSIERTVGKVLTAHHMVKGEIVLIVYENKDDGLKMFLIVLGGVRRNELRDYVREVIAGTNAAFAMLVFPARAEEVTTGEEKWGVMALLEGPGTQRTYLWEGDEDKPVRTLDPKDVTGPMFNFSGLLGQN